MRAKARTATISRLSQHRTLLCRQLATTDIKYLDLGLEYHALPLQFRLDGHSVEEEDCRKAFTISPEHDHDPDLIGYLLDMRRLCGAAEHHLLHFDVGAATVAMETMQELLEALDDQLVALRKCVDSLHQRFSTALDEGLQFEDGKGYTLALKESDGVQKCWLLRHWLLELPQVQSWLRSGVAATEDEALMMAVSAGGEGSDASSPLSVDWSEDEKVLMVRPKRRRQESERGLGLEEQRDG